MLSIEQGTATYTLGDIEGMRHMYYDRAVRYHAAYGASQSLVTRFEGDYGGILEHDGLG